MQCNACGTGSKIEKEGLDVKGSAAARSCRVHLQQLEQLTLTNKAILSRDVLPRTYASSLFKSAKENGALALFSSRSGPQVNPCACDSCQANETELH